jgi:hypothetical protein
VFVDSDVLIAGAASSVEHSASQVVLRMAEITLFDAYCTGQVLVESRRNLEQKIPDALPAFRGLVARCLDVRDDPTPDDLAPHEGRADPKDLPLLVAALRDGCSFLVTFNERDYQPGHPDVEVLRPGALVRRVRALLARL